MKLNRFMSTNSVLKKSNPKGHRPTLIVAKELISHESINTHFIKGFFIDYSLKKVKYLNLLLILTIPCIEKQENRSGSLN